MKFKDKLLVQCVVCLIIFTAVQGSSMIKQEKFVEIKNIIAQRVGVHNSLEDIKEIGLKTIDIILGAPAVLTSAVIEANQVSEFSAPIDKKSDDNIQPVYATSGGVVVYAGIDKEHGSCIKIKHQNKTSVYGNLYTLAVVPGERVTKGKIIATFDNNCGEEFYYQLVDNMI